MNLAVDAFKALRSFSTRVGASFGTMNACVRRMFPISVCPLVLSLCRVPGIWGDIGREAELPRDAAL
jgi:hypothetical protein